MKDAFYQPDKKNVEDKLVRYFRNVYEFYTYVEKNKVLGTIIIRKEKDKTIIEAIGVTDKSRNKGIGRTLINIVKQENRFLYAETDAEAIGFYRSIGFAVKEITRIYNNEKVKRYECIL